MQQSSTFFDGFGRFLESRTVGRVFNFVIIPLLVLAVLLLPPLQVLERVRSFGYERLTPDQPTITDPDGTVITFDGPSVANSAVRARLATVPRADFERGDTSEDLRKAAESLPGSLRPRSPVYQLKLRGEAPQSSHYVVPIPNDSLPYETLDVYNWTGERWEWQPRQVSTQDDTLHIDTAGAPRALMVMQTSPQPPVVGVHLPNGRQLPADAVPATTALFASVLTLRGDGSVDGTVDLPKAAAGPYETYVTVRNYQQDAAPRTDLLANLLIDPGMQETQISTLAELAASGLYAGVALDYRGVDPPLKADYVRFVQTVADRLHQDGKKLIVYLDSPKQVSDVDWETYGYDWQALGAIADGVVVRGPQNPLAYTTGGDADKLLAWAVGQVDRNKLQLGLPGRTVEQSGNYFIFKGHSEALAPLLGKPAVDNSVVEPGGTVQAGLQSDVVASPMQFDPNTGISWYRYRGQSGEERVVFLEDASSLANKVAFANRYNLKGVLVESLESGDVDPGMWPVLQSYAGGQSPASSNAQLNTAWTLVDAQGVVVAQQTAPLGQSVALAVPAAPGEYKLQAELLNNDQPLGSQGEVPLAVATFTPVPTPTPEFTPTPEPTPTPTPLPYAVAVAKGDTNLRSGPGTNYPAVGQLKAGAQAKIIGKNQDSSWWQIEGSDGKPAWIVADRVTAAGPVTAVAVAKDIPQAPAVAAAAPKPAAPAPPTGGGGAPPPAGAGSFGYGIQIQPYGGADIGFAAGAIKGMGFNWVKWQAPWKDMEGAPGSIDLGGQDGLVNFFNGQGINVLASIVKSPNWARPGNTDLGVEGPPADPQTFANFLGAFAGHFCGRVKAIEVWNEQNLHYEWGNEPLDAGRYMELLRRAYTSIKGACPGMIVVSGALTPTGSPQPWAIDDFTYLEQMYQNGLKNYSDAIGAHPSGFNVPPSLRHEQACAFIAQKNASFRGPCDVVHHSWSFRSTMEGYRNIMLKYGDRNKRIWPTEFGWAAGGALHPNYGFANDNSYDEQARWTVESYQMMRNWGFVGPAFLWNLNFGITNPGTELAQWGIWGHPAYDALKNMPK